MFYAIDTVPLSIKQRLIRFICEYCLVRRFKSLVDSICVYMPDSLQDYIRFKRFRLPSVTDAENSVVYSIIQGATTHLDTSHFLRYEKRHTYFFTAYSHFDTALYNRRSCDIIDALLEVIGPSRLVVKVHTNSVIHSKDFAQDYHQYTFVDREVYFFESLYSRLYNRQSKIIVAVASSIMLNVRYMFNEEPYLVLVYRLYDDYKQNGSERDERLAADLRAAYSDPSKIYIPCSIQELKDILVEIIGYKSST